MDQHASTHTVTLSRNRIILPSQVAYDLSRLTEVGPMRPHQLGAGRFAKVYAAQQMIAGLPTRQVAIKILHDNADYQDERLFGQEIALNREFALNPISGLATMLDIVHLGPLVLCGCGTLYHPRCPQGCGVPLQRANLKQRPFPCLRCSQCEYELSAEYVHERCNELYSHKAKPCCVTGKEPHADDGTVINFVLREAMVMERLELSLADFAAFTDEPDPTGGAEITRFERGLHYFGLLPARTRRRIVEQKVRLLSKIDLMVQIGDVVTALHGEKRVVHKDLAPDNIMIRHAPCQRHHGAFASEEVTGLLDQAANLCTQICVIDFGLSDKEKLTRSWYEDAETSLAVTKLPYLSPEARYQRQPIGCNLDFDDAQSRFKIPASLEQSPASIFEQDIIANSYDTQHVHDLQVAKIDGSPGQRYAYFAGAAPAQSSRLEIVRPLGEAHDVYALGAILYYILTGRHHEVEHLSHLVGSIQDQPCRLDVRNLAKRNNYPNRRRAIREPFWRDELMRLIVRAMVRGLPESFVADRTIRGPAAVEAFASELKRIQHGLIAEIFAEREHKRAVRPRQIAAFGLFVLLCVLGWNGMSAAKSSNPGSVKGESPGVASPK